MARLLLLLLCIGSIPSFSALAYCLEDWVCYEKRQNGDATELRISNIRPYPVTVSLSVNSSNYVDAHTGKKPETITSVLEGNKSDLFVSLIKQSEQRRGWFEEDIQWTPGDMNARHSDPLYQLPFAKTERYRVVQGFGGSWSHRGASRYAVDFAMPEGTAVHAARGGVVIDLKEDSRRGGPDRRYASYANFVTVLHDDRTTGEYYHLRYRGVTVEMGQRVVAGQLLGYSGNTGFSSLPHLHFAVYRAKPNGNFESLPFKFETLKQRQMRP